MSREVEGFIPVVSVDENIFYPYMNDPNYPHSYFENADTLESMIETWETFAHENPDTMRGFSQIGIYDLVKGKIVKVFKLGLTEIE